MKNFDDFIIWTEKKLYAAKYGPLEKWPGCLQFLGEEELVLEEYT